MANALFVYLFIEISLYLEKFLLANVTQIVIEHHFEVLQVLIYNLQNIIWKEKALVPAHIERYLI